MTRASTTLEARAALDRDQWSRRAFLKGTGVLIVSFAAAGREDSGGSGSAEGRRGWWGVASPWTLRFEFGCGN